MVQVLTDFKSQRKILVIIIIITKLTNEIKSEQLQNVTEWTKVFSFLYVCVSSLLPACCPEVVLQLTHEAVHQPMVASVCSIHLIPDCRRKLDWTERTHNINIQIPYRKTGNQTSDLHGVKASLLTTFGPVLKLYKYPKNWIESGAVSGVKFSFQITDGDYPLLPILKKGVAESFFPTLTKYVELSLMRIWICAKAFGNLYDFYWKSDLFQIALALQTGFQILDRVFF